MTENGKYKNECAHLTEVQKAMYGAIEAYILGDLLTNEEFIDAMIAVETLGKTMRISHATWKARQH